MIQAEYTPNTRFQPALADAYDVIVMGGGPSGSTTGALTAERGRSTLILERSPVPRFHVGESLIPETYWTLKRLGMLDKLRQHGFPEKYSVQFFSEGRMASRPFYFDEFNPHESSQTWQVERGEFDELLLENARSKGAVVRTDAHVLDVLFEGERAVGVRVKIGRPGSEEIREIRSQVVADATGQTCFLANRLGLKYSDQQLHQGTVWGYFQGALRDPGRDGGATLILQSAGKQSWFWYIPLQDDVVSVGCTGNRDFMFPKGTTPAAAFHRELQCCSELQRRLAPARQHLDFFATKDYSYRSRQAAGPGWVLVGDAFGFIDPVYSTGVFLAFKSGELVADAIVDGLSAGQTDGATLGRWSEEYTKGLNRFRQLVYAFYTPDFSFGEFFRKHPHFRAQMVDILVGAVFHSGVDAMLDEVRRCLPEEMRTA